MNAGFVIDEDRILISPVCAMCRHYTPKPGRIRSCAAFLTIPIEIWTGENKHTSPYIGDNGIKFEKVNVR